ncbi:MAG: hypothetical protein IKN17_10750 [Ruminococcus sp.]|nr:hypothetical protein [Ruminococcus sp.]
MAVPLDELIAQVLRDMASEERPDEDECTAIHDRVFPPCGKEKENE